MPPCPCVSRSPSSSPPGPCSPPGAVPKRARRSPRRTSRARAAGGLRGGRATSPTPRAAATTRRSAPNTSLRPLVKQLDAAKGTKDCAERVKVFLRDVDKTDLAVRKVDIRAPTPSRWSSPPEPVRSRSRRASGWSRRARAGSSPASAEPEVGAAARFAAPWVTSRPGLRVHRVSALYAADVQRDLFLAVTTPSRTLLDLATVLPYPQLRAAADRVRPMRAARGALRAPHRPGGRRGSADAWKRTPARSSSAGTCASAGAAACRCPTRSTRAWPASWSTAATPTRG